MTTFSLENTDIKNYKYTENAFLPKIATVPLIQGDGNFCKSMVKVGDTVSEGDVIGIPMTGAGKVSKIHAPVPGKVIDIISVMNYDGNKVPAVQIKLEGKFSYLGKLLEEKSFEKKSSEMIIDELLEAGNINNFVCSAPKCLGHQIENICKSKKNESKDRAVVVRLFDEDPSRVTDSLIASFYFNKIRLGAKIIAKAISAKNILYLVPNAAENPALVKQVEMICNVASSDKQNASASASDSNDSDDGYSGYVEDYIIENTSKYPYGTEREILSSVNKFFRKNTKFKISKTDFFIDASSLLEVYNSIVLGIPVINKYVHLSGDCLYSSCLLQVKIGTTLKDIINQLGGFSKTPRVIIINGLVCGTEVFDLDVPVTKNVKSIVFKSKYNFCDLNIYPCIKCGNCRNICPVKISPDLLYNSLALKLTLSDAESKSSMLCTDCGLCNTVCPSRLPLSQIISSLKQNGGEE